MGNLRAFRVLIKRYGGIGLGMIRGKSGISKKNVGAFRFPKHGGSILRVSAMWRSAAVCYMGDFLSSKNRQKIR